MTMPPWTININGPIEILVIYQDSGIRDINQEWLSLLTFVIPFIKLIQDMMRAGYNVETTFQV